MSETKFTHAVFNETTKADVSRHDSEGAAQEEADRLRRYHSAPHFQVRTTKESDKLAEGDTTGTLNAAPGDGHLTDAPTRDSLTLGAKKADEVYKEEQKKLRESEKKSKENEDKTGQPQF